ncbi:hypothetical protein PPYR_05393 [Photinus pyralis]|uniref:Uncharacterized protein n=1 Tax=Photinus pyralis TaxID=7054 RepID=A0A5N4AUP6_PHOPY|nr:hypothetical protein PPYR_05393 [Photinus pyralis]
MKISPCCCCWMHTFFSLHVLTFSSLHRGLLIRIIFAENQERLYLYLILSVTAAVVLCLILLVGRLLVQRQHARREAKFHANAAADHSLPNCFTDDISEIDVDIDLPPTNPVPVPNVAVHTSTPMETVAEVVRYPHIYTHTLRRQPETDAPRSLSSTSNTQYYYE